jgi:Prealbumin-like fold domain
VACGPNRDVLRRYRRLFAGACILAAFAALTSLGYALNTTLGYGYGYGYGYQYEYQTGHLIVIKHVVKDNGGTASASDFTMQINGVTATGGNSFPGAESPGTNKEVTTGSYSVTETGPAGYTATFSADCSGSISAGQTKTCTITNNDNAAHLIVIKHVVNANGGKATASKFSMKINGVAVQGANPFPGAESPGTNKTVNAGSYTVTETGPAGYILVPSADCAGTIALGQTKTCTMLNHDIAPRNTIGYWKNHQSQVTALLPQKLGNYTVATFAQATAVFNATNCSSSTAQAAIGCLAGQLLAAELNLANFASPCIQPTVNKATSFLKGGTVTVSGKTAAGVNYVGPSGTYTLNATQRTIAVKLAAALDAYNNNSKSCTNP